MVPRIQLQKAWRLLPEKQGHCAGHNTALLSVGFCDHSLGCSLHCNSASAPASFLTGVSVFHKHPTQFKRDFFPLKYVNAQVELSRRSSSLVILHIIKDSGESLKKLKRILRKTQTDNSISVCLPKSIQKKPSIVFNTFGCPGVDWGSSSSLL